MKAAIYDDQEGQEDGQGDVSKDEKNVRKFPFRASYERFAKVGGPKNIDIVLFDGFDEKERWKAIEDVAKADPNNIQEVAASQLAIVNSYYQSGLQQSQRSFHWSLIWGGIGFGFLIVAVLVLLFQQSLRVAVASGVGGVLVEVFAGTYLYLYKHASDQLAQCRSSLDNTQWLLLANSMCEQLEGEVKQTARAELVKLIGTAATSGQAVAFSEKEKNI